MNSSAFTSFSTTGSSNRCLLNQQNTSTPSTFKEKQLFFAVLIIIGIGLAVAGIGLTGLGIDQQWWTVNHLSPLGYTNSIIMIVLGTGSIYITLVLYLSHKHHNNFASTRINTISPNYLSRLPFSPTERIYVDMYDDGLAEEVSDHSLYMFTDGLGPCIAAIGRCRISESTRLIGITHLFPDNDFHEDIYLLPDIIVRNLNQEELIHDQKFQSHKLSQLINKFRSQPNYNGAKIELFFAGGNGNLYDKFWRELVVEYAKSFAEVNVIGTYFNPYEATQEIQTEINSKRLQFWLHAGITNQGSIVLKKSHDIAFQFQLSVFNSLCNI